jgi:hypothetical protein
MMSQNLETGFGPFKRTILGRRYGPVEENAQRIIGYNIEINVNRRTYL